VTLLGLFLLLAYDGIAQTGKKGGGDKASDGQITNWGQPKAFAGAKTNINAYWIWYDDGVWHFRTTGDGKGARQFQGKIEVVGGELGPSPARRENTRQAGRPGDLHHESHRL